MKRSFKLINIFLRKYTPWFWEVLRNLINHEIKLSPTLSSRHSTCKRTTYNKQANLVFQILFKKKILGRIERKLKVAAEPIIVGNIIVANNPRRGYALPSNNKFYCAWFVTSIERAWEKRMKKEIMAQYFPEQDFVVTTQSNSKGNELQKQFIFIITYNL